MKQQRLTMQHVWDVTGTQEPAPTTACYENSSSTMQYVLGCNWNTDPAPTACYETATFNDATCTGM
jgi:hypothetical protein